MIRNETDKINKELNILCNNNNKKYIFELKNPLYHLEFLCQWKGLKMNQIKTIPQTYLEFESKAKSWLNGRRAPNYGKTLFPEMINSAQKYATNLSNILFVQDENTKFIYKNALIYGYLHCLCSSRVLINHLSNKTYFLCENSVKSSKSETCKLLQKYASDHPYPKQFPAHRKEACDYFEKKYNYYVKSFNNNNNQNNINNNNNNDNNLNINNINIDQQIISLQQQQQNYLRREFLKQQNNEQDSSSNLVFMTLPNFSQLVTDIQSIKMLQLKQQNYINQLFIKMKNLENQLL